MATDKTPVTDFEVQRKRIITNMGMMPSVGPDYQPTPTEFVMNKLGYDPSQDGLYLCKQCGITFDHECDYGGWHGEEAALTVAFVRAGHDDLDAAIIPPLNQLD